MEAIVEENLETKKYRVGIYSYDKLPSGAIRATLRASTDEITEEEAIKFAEQYNAKSKLLQNDRRSN